MNVHKKKRLPVMKLVAFKRQNILQHSLKVDIKSTPFLL
jgi:hypothetical protein